MMRAEGMSGGRDVGVVINLPNRDGPCLLPACGGVGTQYTPATGWAQALRYRARVLADPAVAGCIAVAHGGEASTSTNGFWASLNIATTERLPLLYFIEDNGYGISVPAHAPDARRRHRGQSRGVRQPQDPGRARAPIRLRPRRSSRPRSTLVRAGDGPVLLRLRVPRLSGHSAQDTQAYKQPEEIESERAARPVAGAAPAAGARACRPRPTGQRSRRRPMRTSKRHSSASSRARRFRRRLSRATSSPSGARTAARNCRPRAGSGRTT